ncbi:MAG: permease prefix domain 1-containing protein [Scrofimicrobium sp.]
MEILDNYLDTMFSRYPLTPKTEEAKRELRAMMDDAYNGALAAGHSPNEALGQAISEFGNIDEIAPLLGLESTRPATGVSGTFPAVAPRTLGAEDALTTPDRRPISTAQAKNYAEVMERTRWMFGIAVALLVVSPAALIGFAVAFPDDQSARYAVGLIIGFTVLLPLVGVGVGLLVWRGQQLAPFRRITEHIDACTPEVEAFATGLNQEHSFARTRNLIIAIGLWILSALPVISAGVFTSGWEQEVADPLLAIGVVTTLVLVAAGLLVFLPSDWAHATATNLLQTSPNTTLGEYAESDVDRYPTWIRAVMAGYWPFMAVIYLAWSLLTWGWWYTWIIWPIAGVVFATFAAVVGAIHPPKKPGT